MHFLANSSSTSDSRCFQNPGLHRQGSGVVCTIPHHPDLGTEPKLILYFLSQYFLKRVHAGKTRIHWRPKISPGVWRAHQYIDDQQGFLDPDWPPKSKSSGLHLLFHPSWDIKWMWSYGHNVLLLICLHHCTHTHTHLHTILHSHKPESSWSVFHQNLFWAWGQRSLFESWKVTILIAYEHGYFSRLKGFLPDANFCLFLTFFCFLSLGILPNI